MSDQSIERALNHGGPSQRSSQPTQPQTTADPAHRTSPQRGGSGGEMQVQRQALERAAAAAPEIEEEIRSGLRGVGPDSKEASAGIRGWATAAALDKATAGWISKLNTIADHVGEFEPKLKATAENFEHAEKNTTELIQRLRAW